MYARRSTGTSGAGPTPSACFSPLMASMSILSAILMSATADADEVWIVMCYLPLMSTNVKLAAIEARTKLGIIA